MAAKITEHPSSVKMRHCRQLAKILVDTKTMLESAQNDDWERVVEMEKVRREEMNECFAFPVNEDDSALVAEALAAILHINDELMALLRVSRKKILEEGERVAYQKGAVNNYRDIGGAAG